MSRPRITKISTPKGRPHHRVVHIDGEAAIRVPASLLSELGLEVGDRIAAHLIGELEAADELDEARRRALRLLGVRPRSEEELRRSLLHADFSYSAIETVLDSLRRDGVVDDRAFAEQFADERRRLKGYAPVRIETDLRGRGVEREVAHGAAWRTYEEETGDPEARLLDEAMTLLRHKQVHYEGLSSWVARRRMVGLLDRAGYPASIALDAVDAVLEEMQSQGLLARTEEES